MREEIMTRLRIDPGQLTLGQLLQDREAARIEIARLRSQIDRVATWRSEYAKEAGSDHSSFPDTARPPGLLLRLRDVSNMLGVSRSTIYKWLSEETFPQPVRIGGRAVRWRANDVERWCDLLEDQPVQR